MISWISLHKISKFPHRNCLLFTTVVFQHPPGNSFLATVIYMNANAAKFDWASPELTKYRGPNTLNIIFVALHCFKAMRFSSFPREAWCISEDTKVKGFKIVSNGSFQNYEDPILASSTWVIEYSNPSITCIVLCIAPRHDNGTLEYYKGEFLGF